jgi:hypothetical protein
MKWSFERFPVKLIHVTSQSDGTFKTNLEVVAVRTGERFYLVKFHLAWATLRNELTE